MTRARWPIAGLVLAHVVLHFVALWTAGPELRLEPTTYVRNVLVMLVPSQASLLAVWVAFGRCKFAWRSLATVIAVVVYLQSHHVTVPDRDAKELIAVLLGAVSAVLLLVRVAGVELTASNDARTPVGSRLQFSIRDMFVWMIGLAGVLGALHYWPTEWNWGDWLSLEPSLIIASFLLVAVASIMVSLGHRWLLARLLAFLVVFVGGMGLLSPFGDDSWTPWRLNVLLALLAAWIIGSLLVLRRAGYRLVWRGWFGRKGTMAT